MRRPQMICLLGNLPTYLSRTSHHRGFVARVRCYQSLPAPASQSRFENWNQILTVPVEVVLTPAAARIRQATELPGLVPMQGGTLWAIAKSVYTHDQDQPPRPTQHHTKPS